MSLFSYISLVLLFLVIAGVYLYVPIWRAKEEGKTLTAQSHAYTQTPEHSTTRILVLGDSTAVGTGAPYGHSVAGYIGRDFPNATIVNDSKNGMKLEEFVSRIRARKDEHYDLVVFQIGGNDIVGLTSADSVASMLNEALTISEKMSPNTVVICCGNVGLAPVFRWPLSLFYTHRTRTILGRYKEVISKHSSAQYVDLYVERENDIFLTDIHKYYAPDFFHPSGAGYAVWYEKVSSVLAGLGLLK